MSNEKKLPKWYQAWVIWGGQITSSENSEALDDIFGMVDNSVRDSILWVEGT